MSHIDTLQTFEDLVASGIPETQAKAHVHALDKSLDEVVTKEYLKQELAIFKGELRLQLFLLVVVPIISGIGLQLIFKVLGWI